MVDCLMNPRHVPYSLSYEAALAFAKEQPSAANRVLDRAGDLVSRLMKKGDIRAANLASQLEARLIKAMSETSEQAEIDMMGQQGSVIETVKYIDRRGVGGARFFAGNNAAADKKLDPRMVTEEDVRSALEITLYGVYHNSIYIPIRVNTPQLFREEIRKYSRGDTVIDDIPMIMNVGKARQATEESEGKDVQSGIKPHGLSVDDMINIITIMDDPAYIVLQANGRYAEVVNYHNSRDKSVIAVIDIGSNKHPALMNGYNGGAYNTLVTTYTPDSIKSYPSREKAKVIYDKTKDNLPRGSGRVMAVTLKQSPFYQKVSHPSDDVKSKHDAEYMSAFDSGDTETADEDAINDVDSNGNTLTNAQREWLKNSVTRNSNGSLIVIYHGTPAGGFNTFDINKVGYGSYGYGLYFTASESVANTGYRDMPGDGTPETYPCYLNITNPCKA